MEIENYKTNISGYVKHGFEAVRHAFLANFTQGLEAGASFCVYLNNERIIDLIGGTKDKKQQQLWQTDTIVPVFSTTKAISSLVIALLVERGHLDYDQKIIDIWPEFGAHGKSVLTIAETLSHQAGLSGIRKEIKPEDWFNWDLICNILAKQEPFWPPATKSGYHPVTFGFLAGEIAKRADPDGRTLGTILREDICKPNNIDFFIGTPKSEHHRCADLHKPKQLAELGEINEPTKSSFFKPWSSPGRRGTEAWREFEFGGANGHGTAKALAILMGLALNGKIAGKTYLGEKVLAGLAQSRISGFDLVLPFKLDFAAGLMRNNNKFYGPEETTLGHSGWGGSCAFADRKNGIICAYIMNRQSHILLGDERPLRLIKALYECL